MNENEKNMMKNIMNKYRIIHDKLNHYENLLKSKEIRDFNKLSDISIKIKETINELEKERNAEREFLNLLEKKYGLGFIDPITLEYKIK